MLLSEVKNQILSLGFEDSDVLDDASYQGFFRDGINRALNFINADFPLIGSDVVTASGSDEVEVHDLADNSDFEAFIEAKIMKEVEGVNRLMPFSDFQLVQDSIVYISAGVLGEITFFYRKRPTYITTTTPNTTVMTIHPKAEQLLALMASYYIWNDDDPEKAAKWKNEYEDMRNLIQARTPVYKPLTFTGGL